MSAEIGERLLRWKSGPVLRAYPGYFLVPARDIDEAAAEIVRLRGEMCSCPSGDGSLRWPCKAHPPGAIAPAEAKGDGWEENVRYLLDSYPGSIRVRPGAGHEELIGSLSVTFIKLRDLAMKAPQPADGGAVAFVNTGDSEAQFIADGERLNCPACGGSGHVDDTHPAVDALGAAARRLLEAYDDNAHPFECAEASEQVRKALQHRVDSRGGEG